MLCVEAFEDCSKGNTAIGIIVAFVIYSFSQLSSKILLFIYIFVFFHFFLYSLLERQKIQVLFFFVINNSSVSLR